ncbi:MAG: UDP-2,4-diacetamido-2,4,6-trideoxy-beta-L-altropyranose hydrolase [Candidatus Electrothrix sp. AR4]|nr:UDP-2,4-diacetamido-2,4,6-trideoxy-beta-L-altropyranose hydrolase [Candidatus Electrothrix sp. AR4]
MLVSIRTDASIQIGTGHVMRCLTLAEHLRDTGTDVLFICRELVANLNDLITSKGFCLCPLPPPENSNFVLDWNHHASWLEVPWKRDADQTAECIIKNIGHADWLIVDHYALDTSWEHRLRLLAANIMVIDDLADRFHNCDLLFDQNLYKDYEKRYDRLVPNACLKFLGPKYALLRPEFITARKQLRQRDGRILRVFVFFGGVDSPDLTGQLIEVIKSINAPRVQFDIVTGGGNPHRKEIAYRCRSLSNTTYHVQIDNIAEFMANADIAIGGGGSTIWERCFLGLPSVIVTMADNQVETVEILSRRGALYNMGSYKIFSQEQLKNIINKFIASPDDTSKMSASAFEVMNNYQGVEKIVATLQGRQHALL